MSAHTPGPWRVGPDFMREERVPILSDLAAKATPRRWIVAHTDNDSQGLADARLIAAAPDLLDALRRCADWMEDHGCVPPCLSDARDAIASATDEHPA